MNTSFPVFITHVVLILKLLFYKSIFSFCTNLVQLYHNNMVFKYLNLLEGLTPGGCWNTR